MRQPAGEEFKGKIAKLTHFGAFVELEQDLEGLLHISEIADRRIGEVRDVLDEGDETVVKVIDNYEYYSVSHCPCRQRHKLDPDFEESPFLSEVCLHFDELGRYIVKHGHGREITKEETLQILKKAADAGLVHGLENQTDNPETLCNCDLEYCTFFKPYHHLNFDKSVDQSNYQVEVTPLARKIMPL